MISILISLLIAVIVIGIVFFILSMLPVPQPWMNVAKAIVALILLLWIISMFYGVGPVYPLGRRF
jgi:hypothetical protein